MNIWETMRIGLAGITANKLRSGLTMLGILIGVAAVIVLVAVGNGSSKAVTDRIASLGSNTLTVRSGSFGFGGGDGARTQYKGLSVADAEALLDDVLAPDVSSVSPVSTTSLTCTYDGTSYDTSITGTWPSYFEASNSAVAEGSYFDDADVNSSRRVAVIGQTVVDEMFGDVDPIGKSITCNGTPLEVIGVLESKGSSGFQDSDDVILSPLSTVQSYGIGADVPLYYHLDRGEDDVKDTECVGDSVRLVNSVGNDAEGKKNVFQAFQNLIQAIEPGITTEEVTNLLYNQKPVRDAAYAFLNQFLGA